MSTPQQYDSVNYIATFPNGFTAETSKGSKYTITFNGTIQGRESLEGAYIEAVAGIPKEKKDEAHWTLIHRPTILEFIKQHGQQPAKGLVLLVVLDVESAMKTKRNGLVTSEIRELTPN